MYVASFSPVLADRDSGFCFASSEVVFIFGFEYMSDFCLAVLRLKTPNFVPVSIVSAAAERHIAGQKGDKYDRTGEAETHKYIKGVQGQTELCFLPLKWPLLKNIDVCT